MSEGVEHGLAIELTAFSATCYNLGCRKALSTQITGSGGTAETECYNLGCRKALSTLACRTGPRCRPPCYNLGCRKALSTDCPAASAVRGSRRCYNLGCRKALSTRQWRRLLRISVCYNLGCRKALSTPGRGRDPRPPDRATT